MAAVTVRQAQLIEVPGQMRGLCKVTPQAAFGSLAP